MSDDLHIGDMRQINGGESEVWDGRRWVPVIGDLRAELARLRSELEAALQRADVGLHVAAHFTKVCAKAAGCEPCMPDVSEAIRVLRDECEEHRAESERLRRELEAARAMVPTAMETHALARIVGRYGRECVRDATDDYDATAAEDWLARVDAAKGGA